MHNEGILYGAEGRFRLNMRKRSFTMRVIETMEQVAQSSDRCPIPGNIQGQVRQGSEQHDLVGDIPAYCRRGWTRWSLKVTANPNHSMIQ